MVGGKFFAMLALCCAPVAALAQPGAEEGTLPPGFEGSVFYVGNYTGKAGTLPASARAPACRTADIRCASQPVGGGLRVRLAFEGDHVFGEYRNTDGGRGLTGGTLIGRRTAGGCQLFQTDGTVWHGICDRRGFTGEIASVAGAPRQAQVKFTTVGMHVHDAGQIRARRQAAEARERRIAWLRSRIDSGAPIELRFQAAVELDSLGWWSDGIRPGSLDAPTPVGRAKRGREYGLRSDFTLMSGSPASVTGRVRDGEILCLEYSTEPGICQPLRAPRPIEVPTESRAPDWWGPDSVTAGPAQP